MAQTGNVTLPSDRYGTPESRRVFYTRLQAALGGPREHERSDAQTVPMGKAEQRSPRTDLDVVGVGPDGENLQGCLSGRLQPQRVHGGQPPDRAGCAGTSPPVFWISDQTDG